MKIIKSISSPSSPNQNRRNLLATAVVAVTISMVTGCATTTNQSAFAKHPVKDTKAHNKHPHKGLVYGGTQSQQKTHHGHKHHHDHSHANHHEHGHAHHSHESHHPHWGYAGSELPPEHWGDIEVNKLCKQGKTQSPINITEVTKPNTSNTFNLAPAYQAQDFTIKNNGHTIVFDVKNSNLSKLDINGTTYNLLQFHYHVPSEHTVMNAHYPLELHFVHKNANNGLAVVGVLVDRGNTNHELGKILTNLPSLGAPDSTLEGFDVASIMPQDGTTYAYEGSLTTPPCDEQVQWLLKSQPIHASTEQLKILSALYDGNNRPVQPQGDRTIYTID